MRRSARRVTGAQRTGMSTPVRERPQSWYSKFAVNRVQLRNWSHAIHGFGWLPAALRLRGACANDAAEPAASMAGEQVHFSTNVGDFSVELYPSYAPRTCKNFSELCAHACAQRHLPSGLPSARPPPYSLSACVLAVRGAATTMVPSSTASSRTS